MSEKVVVPVGNFTFEFFGNPAFYHKVELPRNVVKIKVPSVSQITSVNQIKRFKPLSFIFLCISSITLLSSIMTLVLTTPDNVDFIYPGKCILGLDSQEDLFRVEDFHIKL